MGRISGCNTLSQKLDAAIEAFIFALNHYRDDDDFADIDSLYKQLCLFKNRGMSREKMLECLETLQENHEMEDRILELMDFVTGFCSPHMTVYRQKPSIVMPLYETETEVLVYCTQTMNLRQKYTVQLQTGSRLLLFLMWQDRWLRCHLLS